MAERIYIERHGLVVFRLHAYGLAPVAVVCVYDLPAGITVGALAQIDPRRVVCRTVIVHIEKSGHCVPHAECAYYNHHAANNADKGHRRSRLVAHYVSHIPPCAEGKAVEHIRVLNKHGLHLFGSIRSQRVRRRSPQHASDGGKADKRQKNDYPDYYKYAEERHIKLPLRHIEICAHGSARVHDVPRDCVPEAYARGTADDADGERIRRVVKEYASVLEAQRFKRAYLRFFLCAEAVHGRYHSQHRYKQKQNRKHAAHGLSLVNLAAGERVCRRFFFCKNKRCFSDRLVNIVEKAVPFPCAYNVYLGVKLKARSFLVKRGRNVRISVSVIVGHGLTFVAHAHKILGSLYKSAHLARNFRAAVYKRYAVAERDIVCLGILVRKPDTVGAVCIVGFAACHNKR